MRVATFVLWLILAVAAGCSGGDVKVVNIADGSVIGVLAGSPF
jgi:hypothetical protein